MEGEYSCYGGGQFKGGRNRYGGGRFNGRYRGGQFNIGRMIMLQRWSF